jgi:hypothetical protein
MPVRPPSATFPRHRERWSTAHTGCCLSESFPSLMVSAWVVRWLQSEAADSWPAIPGTLSFRRSRCARDNCLACLSGEQQLVFFTSIRPSQRSP